MAGAFRNKFISLGMSCKNWREGIMLFSETHSTGERAVGIAVNAALGTGAIDTDINTFSTIFMANEIPLSLLNSAIDDELLYHFSTKISSIHILSACLLDCVTQIAKIIITDHGVKSFDPLSPNPSPFAPKIEAKNSYSVIRSLCLLFYFPSIMNHGILKSILHPLLKVFNTLPQTSSKVFISWVSRLNNLRRQIIGACHFYISMYFAEISKPDIHSNDIHHVLEALNVIHFANSLSEHPFPAQLFYNHHIDESFDVSVEYLLGTGPEHRPASSNDILDDIDVAFYGDYQQLDESDKETLRAMARIMRERREKKQE